MQNGFPVWYDAHVSNTSLYGERFERIESQKHPVIQTLRELQTEKGRERHGAFQVEGAMVVHRALEYGTNVRFVVCTDRFLLTPDGESILAAAVQTGAFVYRVSEGLMAKIVPGKPPPAVAACVERRLHEPSGLLDGPAPLLFLIDRCENPDNLGMLLRSLDAAGVDGVILTADGVDPFSRLSVRASRGSILSLRLSIVFEPEKWLAEAREREFRVAAASAHGSEGMWSISFEGRMIVVVGNEHDGVRPSIKKMADSVVWIPVAGKMESLNIAVAAAILAYEAARQRRGP